MMVLEGRLLVSLVGKKCGGQSFDDIIMVARANKITNKSRFGQLLWFKAHKNSTSLYLHFTSSHKVLVYTFEMGKLAAHQEKRVACMYVSRMSGNCWYSVRSHDL